MEDTAMVNSQAGNESNFSNIEKMRLAFQFFDQGLSSKQIAIRIGESPGTIRLWKERI